MNLTEKEIYTLVKAAYVIVAPAGQNERNLNILGMLFMEFIPNINHEHIKNGEKMRMREMVKNLESFGINKEKGVELISMLILQINHPKSITLGNEIINILQNNRYSKHEMPELSARLKISRLFFN